MAPSDAAIAACYADCLALNKEKNCAPILIRLAWHDSGNWDKDLKTGGANGSIRFEPEISHGCNAGLKNALDLLEPIKAKHPEIGYADLFQMASAAGVEACGGPKIQMKYGRVDADASAVPPEGRLPGAAAPFHQADGAEPTKESSDASPEGHLRRVFGRMGFNDQEIVALSGAHTLGRVHSSRSGACKMAETKFTKDGPGATKGGQSWTAEWLKFDNSYFTVLIDAEAGKADPELLQLSTDSALLKDAAFKPIAEKYAKDEAAFFADYAAAHKKLSELGSTFA